MKYFLVCNPASRQKKSKSLIEQYQILLKDKGIDFDCGYTSSLHDAETLTQKAVTDGYNVVVAIGGDGTINRVINGLMKSKVKDVKLAVLYSGTSPDFCFFHGIPINPIEAVETLINEKDEKIDICQIQQHDQSQNKEISYFSCSANIGIGSYVAERANRYRKYFGDFFSTFFATVVSIFTYKQKAVVLSNTRVLDKVFNISIGKNSYLASGLKLDIDVTASNGKFYVFAIYGIGKWKLLTLLPKIYSGKITQNSSLYMKILQEPIEIKSLVDQQEISVEFDGDPSLFCPAKISIIPQSINLIK